MNWLNGVLEFVGLTKKPLLERWSDRVVDAVEGAAGSLERTTGRAAKAADDARRRTGAYLKEGRERAREAGERARSGARAQRDAVAERVDAIARRAAEIREQRRQQRQERREQRQRMRRQARRVAPMELNVRDADRIVVRGRRPLNLRMPGGGLIRYRYYDKPGFGRRLILHLTGRRVWPR
ncbi:MAG: hypothetical protein JSU87_00550 [Gemmatimonadota bacterium]|nr:MAG: hypothetical protein JSU87_00550 [Gemmatimonadota bacterium]